MWAISLLTIVLVFPLLSAAPLDIGGGVKDDDGMHSHDENVTRAGKIFGHNQFDVGNISVSGSVAGDDVSIGHELNIDVQGHPHDHEDGVAGDILSIGHELNIDVQGHSPDHHEDDTVIECEEGLDVLFKSINSNKDGLMNAKELLKVFHQIKIQITESLANKTVGFNLAKFCQLLKDFPSANSADFNYHLLQLYDKVPIDGAAFSPPRFETGYEPEVEFICPSGNEKFTSTKSLFDKRLKQNCWACYKEAKPDGCSAPWIGENLDAVFRESCIIHDLCYTDPDRWKLGCDNDQFKNMKKQCGSDSTCEAIALGILGTLNGWWTGLAANAAYLKAQYDGSGCTKTKK